MVEQQHPESQGQTMKVYELAKELGLDSISLLDKLNGLNIKVKNHMSDLGPAEVQSARQSLGKKEAAPAKKPAARTVKKKAAAPADAAPAETKPAAEKKAAATAAKATTTTKTAASRATAAAKPEAAAPAAKTAAPVIRRRVTAGGVTETVGAPVKTPLRPTAEEEAAALQQQQQQQESAVYEESAQPQSSDSETTAASSATEGARAPIAPFGQRPVAPRKSFLKIVEADAPQRPNIIKAAPAVAPAKTAVKGTATQDKDGYRIIKMTKENLDQMVEEEAAKKRGGGREAEIRPEDVRFADYRKKEMVFLPKKKKLPVGKELKKTQLTTPKAAKRVVEMQETISVSDFAAQMGVKANDVIRKLMGMGQMATINQAIDMDTATLVANEYQYEVKSIAYKEEAALGAAEDKAEELKSRPPVVTIMGHVDHGKTTLLDSIREANVAGGEAGGITQHIGAYTVEKEGKLITFIDTPGHEAFTVMRARGANVTDIVILVVAADDGVMPQTREALSHAKAAGVPIIVAVNKIDKPGAQPDKIKQGLAELDLLAEDWGGQTMFVPVSALKKTNLDKLLEAILLQAEVLDLKANPEARASGTVLETRLEKGRGTVVSLLVKRGTLRVGDSIAAGTSYAKVRAMTDDKGRAVKAGTPGTAVEVLGFETLPSAGERFDSPVTENDARKLVENRVEKARAKAAGAVGKVSLEDLFAKVQAGAVKELAVVLKPDVFGSVEAIRDSLVKASTEKVKVKVIHSAPGGITESDVMLANASEAIIIGFNVRPETKARQIAESEGIEIKCYNIIYELIDDVKKAMAGLLDKKKVEKYLGRAEVRQTFSVPKIGTVAGSAVVDGKIVRGANVRLLRDSRVIYEGKMSSLRRFKDDAKEVAQGFECGIGLENYNDLKPGDLIEAYQIEMVAQELNA